MDEKEDHLINCGHVLIFPASRDLIDNAIIKLQDLKN